jgi:hypothetical protein
MVEYNIYGILYVDFMERKSCAFVSAESDWEAIGMLEKYLKEKDKKIEKENDRRLGGRASVHPIAKDTGIKTPEKKIIFGYDVWTDSEF